MSSRNRWLGGCWLAGIVAAFLLGRGFHPQSSAALPSTNHNRSPSATDSTASRVAAALRMPDALASARSFVRVVAALETDAEFKAAFDRLLPDFEQAATQDALFILADAWAARNPAAACAWIDKLHFDDARNPFLFAALSQWAAGDPTAAVAWIETAHPGSGATRDYLLAALVRGTAATDPESAQRLLIAAPNSPERTGAVDFLVQAWLHSGLEQAMSGVASLPASAQSVKERAIRQLVDAIDTEQREQAIQWAASLPDPRDRLTAHAALAASWSRQDPPAAAEWAAAIADPAIRSQAQAEVATRWARSAPSAATHWLAAHAGNPEYDLAARAVAWSTVGIDPTTAFGQIAGITSTPLRDETFEQVGRLLISQQPESARRVIETENRIPPLIRARLLESFE